MAKFEVTLEEGLKRYDDAMDEAEADLIERGLPLAERPTHSDSKFSTIPKMPQDLSQAGYDVLQRLMGEFTEWYNYANCQLAVAYIRQNGAEAKVRLAWAKIRDLKEGTVSDKDDAARVDIRFISVDAGMLYAKSMVTYLNALKSGLEQDIATISRSITARSAQGNIDGRGASVRRGASAGSDVNFQDGRRMPSQSALNPFKKRHR